LDLWPDASPQLLVLAVTVIRPIVVGEARWPVAAAVTVVGVIVVCEARRPVAAATIALGMGVDGEARGTVSATNVVAPPPSSSALSPSPSLRRSGRVSIVEDGSLASS
jgi:hypothetical protein